LKPPALYDIELTTIDGRPESMATYRGLVVLVVLLAAIVAASIWLRQQ
jgi:glutathione peroxidase-family protein